MSLHSMITSLMRYCCETWQLHKTNFAQNDWCYGALKHRDFVKVLYLHTLHEVAVTGASWSEHHCLLLTRSQRLSVCLWMRGRMMIWVAIHSRPAACYQAQGWHLRRVGGWQVWHWTSLNHLGICTITAPTSLTAVPLNGNLQFCWRA